MVYKYHALLTIEHFWFTFSVRVSGGGGVSPILRNPKTKSTSQQHYQLLGLIFLAESALEDARSVSCRSSKPVIPIVFPCFRTGPKLLIWDVISYPALVDRIRLLIRSVYRIEL
jgi:hypothetical protein